MNGLFDLQINGYAGVDFNSAQLKPEDLHAACLRLQSDGVEGILLTLITDDVAAMRSKVAGIVRMCREDSQIAAMVAGLHIEGPFLNPTAGFIGAHPAPHARMADQWAMDSLLEAGQGMVKLVTLAPEMDADLAVTRSLADAGIVVSAGHTDATRDQLQEAIDAGLSMFTHLGNGCPAQLDRHDNIINRALSLANQLWISFIADGAHIPFFVLDNYLKLAGLDRVVIVTDAIAAAGAGEGLYQIGERQVRVGADGVPRCEEGRHFVGSGTTLPQMAANLREELLLSAAEISLIMRENPRKVLALALNPSVS